VTAAAAAAIGQALVGFHDGGLTPATKTQGGDLVAQLYELQQATLGELDFAAVVRREGRGANEGAVAGNILRAQDGTR
jgi:hypothetical protein